MNVSLAFLTGLTAGGLGCLAAQGGLLAACVAREAERVSPPRTVFRTGRLARPIAWFLLARLMAYGLLGFLLGACGSLFQLRPGARAALMVVLGVFMLGNGLRMLHTHRFLRCFVLEPPAAFTAWMRHTSQRGRSPAAALALGALTVCFPCGISQAMMAAALATGNAFQGCLVLLAFTLGTTPLFFVVAYSTLRLGTVLENCFRRFVAVTLVALGAMTGLFGLNLAGVPMAPLLRLGSLAGLHAAAPSDGRPEDGFVVHVTNEGYIPAVLHLPANRDVTLVWVTSGDACCARSVVIPSLSYQALLPETGRTPLAIPAQAKDKVLNYSCAAGRRVGQLVFDLE